jgi:hypothetical protein
MNKFSQYGWNILIAIDQLVNTLCGGDPDETISSRLGKWALAGENKRGIRKVIYQIVNAIVELFQKNHFQKSIETDRGDKKVID